MSRRKTYTPEFKESLAKLPLNQSHSNDYLSPVEFEEAHKPHNILSDKVLTHH